MLMLKLKNSGWYRVITNVINSLWSCSLGPGNVLLMLRHMFRWEKFEWFSVVLECLWYCSFALLRKFYHFQGINRWALSSSQLYGIFPDMRRFCKGCWSGQWDSFIKWDKSIWTLLSISKNKIKFKCKSTVLVAIQWVKALSINSHP